MLVLAGELFVPRLSRLRAGLLRRGNRLGKSAGFGVGGGERADHDGPLEPGQFAGLLGQPDGSGSVAKIGLGTRCQEPGQVIEDFRRLGLQRQCSAITLDGVQELPLSGPGAGDLCAHFCSGQKLQCLTHRWQHGLRLLLPDQGRRQVFGCRHVIRTQLSGQCVLSDALSGIPLGKENMTEIPVGPRMTRIPPHEVFKLGPGLVPLSPLGQKPPQIVAGVVIAGIDLERGAKVFSGFVQLALFREHGPEVVMRQPVARRHLEGMAEQGSRVLPMLELGTCCCQAGVQDHHCAQYQAQPPGERVEPAVPCSPAQQEEHADQWQVSVAVGRTLPADLH